MNALPETLTGGAVLAGGASSRMGSDKALLVVGGRPLVVGVADALTGALGVEAVVVGGDEDRLRGLGLEVLPDRAPGAGPLGGILTALLHHRERFDQVVVLSCDLPEPSPESIRAVAETASDEDAIAVPVLRGRRQWMHAAWPIAVLPALEEIFQRGERAPHRAVADLAVVEVDGLDPHSLRDIDRLEDLDGEPPAGR